MPYRAFRESYRRAWLECPLSAYLLWRRYAERHRHLSRDVQRGGCLMCKTCGAPEEHFDGGDCVTHLRAQLAAAQQNAEDAERSKVKLGEQIDKWRNRAVANRAELQSALAENVLLRETLQGIADGVCCGTREGEEALDDPCCDTQAARGALASLPSRS